MTDGKPMQAQCGAHCRTTGQPCKNAPMPNGRCRMHGGKSTGRPIKHGFFAAADARERREIQMLSRALSSISSTFIKK